MKYDEIKLKQHIHDRWWPLSKGVVTLITKSYVYVLFNKESGLETWKYDKSHLQFLSKGWSK